MDFSEQLAETDNQRHISMWCATDPCHVSLSLISDIFTSVKCQCNMCIILISFTYQCHASCVTFFIFIVIFNVLISDMSVACVNAIRHRHESVSYIRAMFQCHGSVLCVTAMDSAYMWYSAIYLCHASWMSVMCHVRMSVSCPALAHTINREGRRQKNTW